MQLLSELQEEPQKLQVCRQSPICGEQPVTGVCSGATCEGQVWSCAPSAASPPQEGDQPHLSLVEVECGGKRMYWTTQVCFSLPLLLSLEPSIWRGDTA